MRAAKTSKKSVTFTDARGNRVSPGSRVAYNYSGDIATGTVVAVTASNVKIERDSEWTTQYKHVKQADGSWVKEFFENPQPEYSNVKNRRSVLVINESAKATDHIAKVRGEMSAAYAASLEEHRQRFQSHEDALKEKLTEMIKCIANAWDLDEVKDKMVELYGEDVLKHEEEVPEWIAAILNGN